MATTTRSKTTRKPATKRRATASTAAPKTAKPAAPKAKSGKSKTSPYVKAAVATGAVAAAAVGAAYLIRKSDKSVGEIADDLKTTVMDGLAEAKSVARDSARSIKDKASTLFDKGSAEFDIVAEDVSGELNTARGPVIDDKTDDELRTGAISY